MINQEAYLNRINYEGELDTSPEVLNRLQKQHLLAVPFENLDIHYRKKIDLEKSYDKIVVRRRGGFCYELNGLFYELLKSLGFKTKLISARVYDKNKGYGREFDHMAIIATINDAQYLVDVGFGEFTFYPVKMELNKMKEDQRGKFKIEKYDDAYLQISKIEGDEIVPQYLFSGIERKLAEYTEMCNYHQTSPDSHFTQKRVCSLPTEKGRITISGNVLKIKEDENIREIILNDEEEFNKTLWEYFKIKI
jgi:N-hydroxyarylamine O-acetyltransferase